MALDLSMKTHLRESGPNCGRVSPLRVGACRKSALVRKRAYDGDTLDRTWCTIRMVYKRKQSDTNSEETSDASGNGSQKKIRTETPWEAVEERLGTRLPTVAAITPVTCRQSNSSASCNALPRDPRTWSRQDVHSWLYAMQVIHDVPDIDKNRFLMNGKALCLMSMDMFSYRVPLGGKLLYKDFRMRLARALMAPSGGTLIQC